MASLSHVVLGELRAEAAGPHAHHGIDLRIEIAPPEDGHSDVVLASGRASV
jgi:hypothetical protein